MRDFQGGGKWEKIGVNYATLRNISQWKKDKEVEANKNWAESLHPPPPPVPLSHSPYYKCEFRVGSCGNKLCKIALFTVTFSHLHYNVFELGCEAISDRNYKIARNCLTSTLKNIVMQMRKGNCEKGYCAPLGSVRSPWARCSVRKKRDCW